MPRSIDFLDYLVPEGMRAERGDLVEIPFRSRAVRGVVLSTAEESSHRARPIHAVLQRGFLDDACLSIFEESAKELIQSTATMLHQAFLKRAAAKPVVTSSGRAAIRRKEIGFIQQALAASRDHASIFVQTLDFGQMAAIVEGVRTIDPKAWVLVSHKHDQQAIPGSMTRQASLSIHEHPKTIIVVRSGSPEHEQYDRNPRYDARDLSWKMQKAHGTRLVFLDVAPRVQDLVHAEEIVWLDPALAPETTLVDFNAERQRGFQALLTDRLVEATQQALQSGKKVLLSYNRKEGPARFSCADCGTENEPTERCVKCHGTRLRKRGVSNRDVEKRLMALLPEAKIIRVEKGHVPMIPDEPCVILATRFYTETVMDPLHPPSFGLVAELHGDQGLTGGWYDATEQALIHLAELRGIAGRCQAAFLVQTWDTALMRRLLDQTADYLQEERATRAALHYPPFGTLYQLSVRGAGVLPTDLPSLERPLPPTELPELQSRLKSLKDSVIIRVWH